MLVIDECSFLVPESIHCVDVHLRPLRNSPDTPFGGVAIILAGDFRHKPSPSGVPLAELLVATEVPALSKGLAQLDPTSNRARGLAFFRDAERTVLNQQMRAAEDPRFQQEMLRLRDTQCDTPVPSSLVDSLKEVTMQDIIADPEWACATIAVLANYEQHHLNHLQANVFARKFDIPLVMFKQRLSGRATEVFSCEDLDRIYNNEPGLWGAFARDALAMLTESLQPTKFLVNGACGYMHSLTFADDAPEDVVESLSTTGHRLIVLEEGPRSINFQPSLPDNADGAGIESLVDEAIVVPILCSRQAPEHDASSLSLA